MTTPQKSIFSIIIATAIAAVALPPFLGADENVDEKVEPAKKTEEKVAEKAGDKIASEPEKKENNAKPICKDGKCSANGDADGKSSGCCSCCTCKCEKCKKPVCERCGDKVERGSSGAHYGYRKDGGFDRYGVGAYGGSYYGGGDCGTSSSYYGGGGGRTNYYGGGSCGYGGSGGYYGGGGYGGSGGCW